jgi:hypothetical protein
MVKFDRNTMMTGVSKQLHKRTISTGHWNLFHLGSLCKRTFRCASGFRCRFVMARPSRFADAPVARRAEEVLY